MPLFNKFHLNFDKYILSNYSEDDAEFYEKILPFVHKFVVPFLEDLPAEFSNLFSELYELIVDRISNKGEKLKPLQSLKHLFNYHFFLNPDMKIVINPKLENEHEK